MELVRQPHGGAIQRGNPGNRGRSPDGFRRRLRALASNDDVLAYLERCLLGEEGAKVAIAAWRYVTEQGYGPPAQQLEVSGIGILGGVDMQRLMAVLSDDQLARMSREHPLLVLAEAARAGADRLLASGDNGAQAPSAR